MKLLENALKDKKFDIRMKDKNLQRGIIEYSEFEKYFDQLPDDAELAEYSQLDAHAGLVPSDSSSSH